MPEYTTPPKNQQLIQPIGLFDSDGALVTDPTISAGDFKVYTDGVDMGNMDNLPTVTPAGGVRVELILSAAEMNGDTVMVYWHDPDGAWRDGYAAIQPTGNPLSGLSTTAGMDAAHALLATPDQVNEQCDAALADYDPPTKTELDAALAGLNDVTAAEVWTNPERRCTIVGATFNAAATGDTIIAKRGDFWSFDITGGGSVVGRVGEKLYFTIKASRDDTDLEATIDISETTGLLRANGADPAQASDGSLTVLDEVAGNFHIEVEATVTALFTPGPYCYDMQVMRESGPETLFDGTFNIPADVKRGTS